MIFGFGKKRDFDEDEEARDEEEAETILFQGAFNGKEANLTANARLAQAGLMPAKQLLTDAIRRRAHLLRIEPKGDRALVQISIDGIAYAGARLSKQQGLAVTQILKLLSGLNIQQRSKPQSGGVRAEFEGTKYEIRIATAPIAEGVERLVMKIRDVDHAPHSAADVGFTSEMKEKIRSLTCDNKGILLVCGTSGSGVSTTMYGVLRSLDAYQYTIYTVGDRQWWDLPNVSDFKPNEGEDLATLLDRAIRSEANVVYVDPIRDTETAQLLVKLQTKTMFIAEFPAPDAIQGIVQFAKLVGNKEASESLSALISQKLVRTLCPDCKLGYRPNPKLLAKIGLPPETKSLFRAPTAPRPNPDRPDEVPEPCDRCGGVGYLGRTAMFEVVEMTPDMRKLVAAGASPQELKNQTRKEGMLSFQQEGLNRVVEGKTSLEELQRTFQAKK